MSVDDYTVGPEDVGTGRFRKLRAAVRVRCPLPSPGEGDPSDDDLLRYLDGLMSKGERLLFERRLAQSPHATARVEILSAALEECGWVRPSHEDDPA